MQLVQVIIRHNTKERKRQHVKVAEFTMKLYGIWEDQIQVLRDKERTIYVLHDSGESCVSIELLVKRVESLRETWHTLLLLPWEPQHKSEPEQEKWQVTGQGLPRHRKISMIMDTRFTLSIMVLQFMFNVMLFVYRKA